MFYGRGAGKFPTASAVVGDVIDCAKHLSSRKYLHWNKGDENYVADSRADIARFFVRLKSNNLDNTKKDIETKLNTASYIVNESENEIVLVTENDIEATLINQINSLDCCEVIKMLHVID